MTFRLYGSPLFKHFLWARSQIYTYNNSSGFAKHSIGHARLVSPDFQVTHYLHTENRLSFKAIKCSCQMNIFLPFDKVLVPLVIGFHVRFNRFIIMWQFSLFKRERPEISLCFQFFCFYNSVDPKRTSHQLKLTPEALPPTQCFSTSDLFGFKDFFPSTHLHST